MQLLRALFLLLCIQQATSYGLRSKQCGHGYKCFPYRVTSRTHSFELRTYEKTTWITWEEQAEITSMSDFQFLVEYTDRKLGKYFDGVNYLGQKLDKTTPLRIDIPLFHLDKPRRVSYPVRVEHDDNIPAPLHPLFISEMDRTFFYVRQVPGDMSYKDLLHVAAEFMTDLAVKKFTFEKDEVHIVIYNRPLAQQEPVSSEGPAASEESSEETPSAPLMNEIWIRRSVRADSYRDEGSAYGGRYGGHFGGGIHGGGSRRSRGDGDVENTGFSDRSSAQGIGTIGGTGFGNGLGGNGRSSPPSQEADRGVLKDLTQERKELFVSATQKANKEVAKT